jgi:catechol 2,3-dioxygenase-like lactoylglutathione lyase family enzyme
MITQVGLVTVVVKNLEKARRFYRDKLGLRVIFYNKKLKWLTFDCGTTLSLTVPWDQKSKKLVGARTGISFYTDDIAKTYAMLKRRRVTFRFPPRQEKWGAQLASFQDPDGNRFFLLQMPRDYKV